MRKIILGCLFGLTILWIGIFLFTQYKVDSFIQQFSPNEVKISYKKLYVKFGITDPLIIIIKDMKAVANGVTLNADLRVYPRFSNISIVMNLAGNDIDNHCNIPITIRAEKSVNSNFYLARIDIQDAYLNINNSRILIDGGIEFHQSKLPIGGYDIVINDTQRLLKSPLLEQYPNILYKLQKILHNVENTNPKFRLDYTETGMKLDGVPVETL